MSSAKPDHNEIRGLRKERKLYDRGPNLFNDLHQACRSTIEGGYVTKERAEILRSLLRSNEKISAIFPNNLLCKILDFVCSEGNWSSDNEKTLLTFIAGFYLDYSLENDSIVGIKIAVSSDFNIETGSIKKADCLELIKPPDIRSALLNFISSEGMFSSIAKELMFDSIPERINFHKKFVAFTGNFEEYSRKSCFEIIRKFGGVPSDPEFFTDYLFVAKKSVDLNTISNQLAAAIYFRSLYGNPLIFTEENWSRAVDLGYLEPA